MKRQTAARTVISWNRLLLLLVAGMLVGLGAVGVSAIGRGAKSTDEPSAETMTTGSYPASEPGPALGVTVDRSMRVIDVETGSVADNGGIQRGDVIEALTNVRVTSPSDAARLVRDARIGQGFAVRLRRGNQSMTLNVTMARRAAHPNQPTPTPVPNSYFYV